MTPTRWLLAAIWLFLGVMLVWQFHDYNQKLVSENQSHPRQTHFYFYANPNDAPAPKPKPKAPDVQQVAFSVDGKSITRSNFTCNVTLKNVGNVKAINVRVLVRPFRGISAEDEDAGGATGKRVTEESPLSQYGQWVEFPDLMPGETETRSVDFYRSTGALPGGNPQPSITFDPFVPPAKTEVEHHKLTPRDE